MTTRTHRIHHIHTHLHVPTQICLIPLHGCPPPHACLTHCPPACPPMGAPSSTMCPLVLIASMPTHMSLHRYVSSPHTETFPLLIVAPAIHTSCTDAPHLTSMYSPLLSFSCTPAAHKPVLTTL